MKPFIIASALMITAGIYGCGSTDASTEQKNPTTANISINKTPENSEPPKPAFDTAAFDKQMQYLANGDTSGRWPVKTPYPLPGAIFPFNRVVAYYGNLFSTQMGVLGEYPKSQMLHMLKQEVKKWEKADGSLPVIPALHYIAVTAQGLPGKDGKYRLRMPFRQIDTIYKWAQEIKGITFVDVQVGLSTLQNEIPEFDEYLKRPDFHLGIDPEFSMKGGEKPGSVIGTFNAADINWVINHLSEIVKNNNLPPKILVVHRFTNDMVKNYKDIKPTPEVQVVIDMDGWGGKSLKAGTWKRFIYEQPIQFAGVKLFYKNDLKNGGSMFTPEELTRFTPKPVYVQYQ
jgi:hypothetical protein